MEDSLKNHIRIIQNPHLAKSKEAYSLSIEYVIRLRGFKYFATELATQITAENFASGGFMAPKAKVAV